MANKELASLLIENNIVKKQKKQGKKINALLKSETKTGLATNITDDLGDLRIGNLLCAASGYPDDGTYTGTFISLEGFVINGVTYHIGGMKDGRLMWAGNSDTGKFVFCGGNAYIDSDGMTGSDLLKWMIRQTAANDVYTRTGKLGMALKEGGGTIPVWQLSYENDAGVELATNGDFETGDFTGWTKTTETNGNWVIESDPDYVIDGSYSLSFAPTDVNQSGVLTSDRITGIADKNIEFSGKINIPSISSGTRLAKIEIKWYDHASAGSLLQTDILGQITSTAAHGLFSYSSIISAPAGALSCAIVITNQKSEIPGAIFYDSISVKEVAVNQKLWLEDDGVGASGVTSDKTSALSSGTYTPTPVNTTNVDASTASEAMWIRIGDNVYVSLYGTINPTANAATVLGIPLPIASDFTDISDCAGTGKIVTTSHSAAVVADPTNNRALVRWAETGTTTSQPFVCHFMYKIL